MDEEPPDELNSDESVESEATPDEAVKLVHSELLTYVACYVNKCSPLSIIDTVSNFFSSQDIINAKNVLWDSVGDALFAKKTQEK